MGAKKDKDKKNMTLREQLTYWDHEVSYSIYRAYQDLGHSRSALHLLEYSGHGILWLLAVAITFLRHHTLTPDDYMLLCNLFFGLITDILLVSVVKLAFRRTRPHWESNQKQFATVDKIDQFSFPSGHTTRSVYIASFVVLAAYVGHFNSLPAVVSTAWACVVAVSRVAMGRHHVLDVLAGFLVGGLNILIVSTFWIEKEQVMAGREYLLSLFD
eukprot:comp17447_c0_seq1/m.16870 comp17447_c0_seq1/g.16870  ORF comp17447_c0_seq1/g.16870 comp17447_c0_seq1/m.16870 type:complete len:214 (-) comp17447_c0_seq1:294-935(-)